MKTAAKLASILLATIGFSVWNHAIWVAMRNLRGNALFYVMAGLLIAFFAVLVLVFLLWQRQRAPLELEAT